MPPPPDFVGRDEDLKALESRLSGGAAISAVHGLGGVGKTALALKLAERQSRSHPDGQLFFDLQGYTRPRTWQEAMAHVIHAFLPEERLPDGDAKLAALYRTVLTGKRVLLVLDNAADEELVRRGKLAEAVPLMEAGVRYEEEIGHPDAAGRAARLEKVRQRLAAEARGPA